jgi:diguanylate cyclase (GGDEF)-like protein
MLASQDFAPPLVSVLFANFLIMGGRLPVLIGLGHFWNQENSKLPFITGIVLVVASIAFYYFTLINESILWRVRICTATIIMFNACFVFVVYKGLVIERKIRPAAALSASYGVYILIILFSFNTLTETILLFLRGDVALSDYSLNNSSLLIGYVVTVVIFTSGVLLMTMEELTAEHHENAIYDPVTTILNGRTLTEVGNRVLGIALRYTKPVSLLTLEVTNLNEVINAHGFKVGNKLIHHFALIASDRRRHEDVLARSGLKTFRVILTGVDEAGAAVVLENIRNSLRAEEFVYRGNNIKVKVAASIITRREDDLHLQQMLQDGDVELLRYETEVLTDS